ncbi:MAG: hypothetical protein O2992_14590 [Gemmatimonadetes bacterium]|nr:hypothetical protein [Gemmatimonadota bacterium]
MRAIATVCALVLMSVCIGRLGKGPDPFGSRAEQGREQLRVEIQNLNFNDATVFALRQGQRIRLGEVTGKSDGKFTVEWNLALPVEFMIDFVGGQSCTVGGIPADPGSTIWIQVPADICMSRCRGSRR